MRVLFVINTFPSLSQTFILSQITGLIDLGVDVRILAWKPSGEEKVHDDVTKYGLLDRVEYAGKMIKSRPKRVLNSLLKTPGLVSGSPMAALRCWNGLKFGQGAWLGALVPAARALKKIGPCDVVHAHFGPVGEVTAKLRVAGLFDAPLVTTFYGYDASRHKWTDGGQAYPFLFSQASQLLVLSEVMRERLLKMNAEPSKTVVHHLGVDVSRFDFRERQPETGRPVRLVTVARLAPKKGLPDAVRAVAELRKRFPNVKYEIVGDGPVRPELEKLIAELDLGDTVLLRGWMNQDEVSGVLDESDIFLSPSVVAPDGDEEGTPTAIIEASARGLPIVSTLHSGIPEIVTDGESGYLVEEHDVEALADRLYRLAIEPETWSVMGRAGRAIVEAQFDTKKLNAKVLGHYRELV